MDKLENDILTDFVDELLNIIPTVNFSVLETENKKDDSVVTNVDYQVNNIVIGLIKKLFGDDVPIISEEIEKNKEFIEDCFNRDICFIIDPIDGTMALCAGLNTCTISIGIMSKGVITDGIIYLIDKNEVIFTNGNNVYVKNKLLPEPVLFKKIDIKFKDGLAPVSIASSLARTGFNEKRPIFVINASVFSMYKVFQGIFEKTYCRTKLWDIAACLAIGERLGCNFYICKENIMKKLTSNEIVDFVELNNKKYMLSVGDINIVTYLNMDKSNEK